MKRDKRCEWRIIKGFGRVKLNRQSVVFEEQSASPSIANGSYEPPTLPDRWPYKRTKQGDE